MTIEPTASSPGLTSGHVPTTPPKQELDSEVFMALLVAQLRNQDPSSPMDTNQMMSQQIQLASMEKLTDVADTGQEQFALSMRMAALGIVGREVSYTDADGTIVEGSADSASFANSVPTISVGGNPVELDRILAILPTDD